MKISLLVNLVAVTTLFQGSAFAQEKMDLPLDSSSTPVVTSTSTPPTVVAKPVHVPIKVTHKPTPKPAPRPRDPYAVGATVYVLSGARQDTSAQIVGVESTGNFVLQFDSDSLEGGGWGRDALAATTGCSSDLCVGETVYTITGGRAYTSAQIVGLSDQGFFVLQFDSDGRIGDSWDADSLARTKGCNKGFCVGNDVLATDGSRANQAATVVGVAPNDTFVLQFDSDSVIGGNWKIDDMAKKSGCSHGLCVGTHVCPLTGARKEATAVIIGIQGNGAYVLQFDSDGAIGADWDSNSVTSFH